MEILARERHGFRESPEKHLKGAANFDVWLFETSRTALPGSGAL
jgi:hypothetical protein